MRSYGSGVRSSVRSRSSSSTTGSGDPRGKVKDCCRQLVAFMCTQVGVGGLIVGYAIVGALGFMFLEKSYENPLDIEVANLKNNCATELWNITKTYNNVDELVWKMETNRILGRFQEDIVFRIKKGYSSAPASEMWTFPAALMFCLAVFTMIGYGNLVPKTAWGKGITVLYAVFGIPLYVLYFMNMGKVLASTFRWMYRKIRECTSEPRGDAESGSFPPSSSPRYIVPSTACLWVILFYILTGTIMFAEWENWEYLDSVYFCVTSLCKIGIGDFVPGKNVAAFSSGSQGKLIINFVYLLVGMGLVAMCYNIMKEDVREKMRQVKQVCLEWLETVRSQVSSYFPVKNDMNK